MIGRFSAVGAGLAATVMPAAVARRARVKRVMLTSDASVPEADEDATTERVTLEVARDIS